MKTTTECQTESGESLPSMQDIYDKFVQSRLKGGESILSTMNPHRIDLIHMALGLSGEAGEIVDAIKKHALYNKELDYNNVKEELGDMEFFMSGMRKLLGFTREEILDANIAKLTKRYEKGYSDKEAIERADKPKNLFERPTFLCEECENRFYDLPDGRHCEKCIHEMSH